MKKFSLFVFLVLALMASLVTPSTPVFADPGNGNGNGNAYGNPDKVTVCKQVGGGEWKEFEVSSHGLENGNQYGWGTEGTDWYLGNCQEEITTETSSTEEPVSKPVSTQNGGFCFTEEVIMATAETWPNNLATSDIIILSEKAPLNLTRGAKYEYYEYFVISKNGCEGLATHYAGSDQSEIVRVGFFQLGGQIRARVVETITNTPESESSPEYGPGGSIYFTRFVTGGNVAYQRFPSGEEKVVGANIAQFAFNEEVGKTAVLLNNGEVRWLDTGRLISDDPEFFSITWKDNLLWGIDREGKIQGNLGLENKKIKVEMEKEFFVYVVGDTRLVAHDKEWNLFLFREEVEGKYEQENRLDLTGYFLEEGSIVLWSPEE